MSDPSSPDHARLARKHYERPSYQAFLRRLGEAIEAHLRDLIGAAGIPESQSVVEWRVKAPASFAQKAARTDPEDPTRLQYRLPCDEISDQLALRVIVFLPAQVEAVEQAIADDEALTVREVRNKGWQPQHDDRQFGYQSVHVLVDPGPQLGVQDPPKDYRIPRVEIQLRTQLQHVWAELEHASRYKGAAGSRVSRKFDRAAALIEMVDELLQEIDDASAGGSRADEVRGTEAAGGATTKRPDDDRRGGSRLTARALRSLLAEVFPSAPPSRGAGSEEWIRRHALELGLDTVETLRETVRGVDLEAIDRTFREGVTWERNQVRCLDDALLAATGPRYLEIAEGLVGEDDAAQRQKRPRVLGWRLKRLREAGILP